MTAGGQREVFCAAEVTRAPGIPVQIVAFGSPRSGPVGRVSLVAGEAPDRRTSARSPSVFTPDVCAVHLGTPVRDDMPPAIAAVSQGPVRHF